MTAWTVVIATVVVVAVVVVVLARQGYPGGLSEEQNRSQSGQLYTMERPAGPDAESMHAEPRPPSPDEPDT
jgi:preprotein translocase subunit SecG